MESGDEKKFDSPAPRRIFLKQGLVSIAGLAAVAAIPHEAQASEDSAEPVLKPARPWKSQRVLESKSTGEPPRQQQYLESEIVGSNDVKLISKIYTKRTDFSDSYDLLTIVVNQHFLKPDDTTPQSTVTYTSSVTGIKGEIKGEYRLDTLTTTSISPQGVSSEGPKQVQILLKDPTSGMTDQERMNWMINRKAGGA